MKFDKDKKTRREVPDIPVIREVIEISGEVEILFDTDASGEYLILQTVKGWVLN